MDAGGDKTHTLKPNEELRLECPAGKHVAIKLEDGSGEVFGTELHRGQAVPVTGQKVAVYTWEGCRVTVQGEPSVMYVADETPMASYLNVHQTLNQRREAALRGGAAGPAGCTGDGGAPGSQGPVVVVLGPTDSGKSTLCRMLCNWAVRSGWQPTLVDLDVGQGSITVPGCVSAVPIEQPIDISEGLSGGADTMPLVFFYGHASPGENPTLFRHLVDKLAALLARRAASDPKAAAAGLIVNTFGWVDGLGYELQKHAIQALGADVVLVMEQDRLHAQLQQDFKAASPRMSILKLAKSGGAVKREGDERRNARDARIREYFYGASGGLQPATQTKRATELVVYRIGSGPRAPNTALPIGAVSLADPLRLQNLPVSLELLQCLVAVSHAPTPDQILNANVAGFVLIKDVDTARGEVTFTSPAAGPLPGRYLIMGSMRSSID